MIMVKINKDEMGNYNALRKFVGQKLMQVHIETSSTLRATSDVSGVDENVESLVLTFTEPKK